MTGIRIVHAGIERVDELQSLWADMHAHHAGLGEMPPVRTVEESWHRRRAQYVAWLEDGEAQLLIAEDDGPPVGYAMLRIGEGAPTWNIGESVAELESLSVAAGARSQGVGQQLVSAARAAATAAGADRMLVGLAHSNAPALRFYERAGFTPFYLLMVTADAEGSGGGGG